MERLSFKLQATASHSKARAGTLITAKATVDTPVFMPVGTAATVKGLRFHELEDAGSRIMLANTYHLLLRPGPEVFERMGGIQKFANWSGLVLTDSGGFQVFSLAEHVKISKEGAYFKSHIDGRSIVLTPESCISTQKSIGSDIMMVLDQCVPSTSSYEVAKAAMNLTHEWALRSLAARGDSWQALFGIVQGACFVDLRQESARHLAQLPFEGFAIGGLAVGESITERQEMTALVTDLLPQNKPRYLMGVGTPLDLLDAVHRGVDMFDCILPSALSAQGVAYTSRGTIRLARGVYRFSQEPVDRNCRCYTCTKHSIAYIHHLIKAGEQLGWHLLSIHNLSFYHQLMSDMRTQILADTFADYYAKQRQVLEKSDEDFPVVAQKQKRRTSSSGPKLALGNFEVIKSNLGFASIRQISSGETMHSSQDPDEEARSLYVEQSQIVSRIQGGSDQKPLVLWDVGLGAAHNAMATIRALEASYSKMGNGLGRPVQLISFENDLDALRLVLKNPSLFAHIHHSAPQALLKTGFWQSAFYPLTWSLVQGDFLKQMVLEASPHVIYYDPFSAKSDADLWTWESFRRLHHAIGDEAISLYTYSASTAVRATLLAAGFYVGTGQGTGSKGETTIALTSAAVKGAALKGKSPYCKVDLLNQAWRERWQRSSAKFAKDVTLEQQEPFANLVQNHPQFQ
jgi:queuine tRNA-ribosyltransferase